MGRPRKNPYKLIKGEEPTYKALDYYNLPFEQAMNMLRYGRAEIDLTQAQHYSASVKQALKRNGLMI